jgi:hypothetical protein
MNKPCVPKRQEALIVNQTIKIVEKQKGRKLNIAEGSGGWKGSASWGLLEVLQPRCQVPFPSLAMIGINRTRRQTTAT